MATSTTSLDECAMARWVCGCDLLGMPRITDPAVRYLLVGISTRILEEFSGVCCQAVLSGVGSSG